MNQLELLDSDKVNKLILEPTLREFLDGVGDPSFNEILLDVKHSLNHRVDSSYSVIREDSPKEYLLLLDDIISNSKHHLAKPNRRYYITDLSISRVSSDNIFIIFLG